MYFQSLASLDDTVESISQSEIKFVQEGIDRILNHTVKAMETTKEFLDHDPRIMESTSSEVWGNVTRELEFLLIKASPQQDMAMLGLTLVAHEPSDPTALYSCVWGDPLKHTPGETMDYVHALYGNHLGNFEVNYNTTPHTAKKMTVNTVSLDEDTGKTLGLAYTWNGTQYANSYLPIDWDPAVNDTSPWDDWEAGHPLGIEGSAVLYHEWRAQRTWRSKDGTIYTYGGVDAVYAPPPPPHPWSRYRAMLFYGQFFYSAWEHVMEQYNLDKLDKKDGADEAELVVVDTVTLHVYAATNSALAASPCKDDASRPSLDGCDALVSALPIYIQELFYDVRNRRAPYFQKKSLDGKDFYAGSKMLHRNVMILWLRPSNSVDKKVQEALTLLIVFTALVLVFDAAISLLEVVFIAMPLSHLSKAIQLVGNMQTEEASLAIQRYETKTVMVHEIQRLIAGMSNAASRLEEYRTFIPLAVRMDDLTDPEDEKEGTHSDTTGGGDADLSNIMNPRRTSSRSSRSASLKDSALAGSKQLLLNIQKKKIGLAVLNIKSWSRFLKTCSASETLSAHTDLVVEVYRVVSEHNGVLESFSGDRFLCGWNTAKGTIDYVHLSTRAANEFAPAMKKLSFVSSCGLSSGAGLVGNMGTAFMRRFGIIGNVVPWVVELEEYGKAHGVSCCTDKETMTRCNTAMYELLDGIFWRKTNTTVTIARLRDIAKVTGQEWMYELQETQTGDEVQNSFIQDVLSGNWDLAEVSMEKPNVNVSERMRQAVKQRKFIPLQRPFCSCSEEKE